MANPSRLPISLTAILALLIVCCLTLVPSQAQNGREPGAVPEEATGVVDEQQTILDGLTNQVSIADKAITANAEDDGKLVDTRLVLEDILGKLLASGVAFRPRLSEINGRLTEIGPPPKDGEPAESPRVTTERQALTAEKAEINVLLGKAEDLSVKVNGMINRISILRRDLFTNQLTKRNELTDAIGKQVISDLIAEGRTLRERVGASWRFVYRFKSQSLLAASLLALLAAAVVQFGGKWLFGGLMARDPALEHPSYINRLAVAFWSAMLPALAGFLCIVLAMSLYEAYGIVSGGMANFVGGILGVIYLVFIVHRLAHAVLSPDDSRWRLIRIESRPAYTLVWLLSGLALLVGIDSLGTEISDWLSSPLSVTIVKSLLGAVLSGILIVAIARVRPFVNSAGAAQPWPAWVRIALYVLGIGSVLAAVSGYISLAQFISEQIVVTGAMVTTAYIGLLASRAISDEGGFAKTAVGRWMKNTNGTEDSRLDQLGVLASVLINILIVLLFLPLLLFQWRFQPGDIATWIRRAASGFQIGTFSFSPFAILTGVAVFVAGYVLTRWFQRWLDGTVMARGKVELGVRNSIRTVVGYAGMALAALVAISSAGLDLSNFALVAGGLSLGIGFGLQNIVSNFVSGLILLAERPLKVGDWVEAGTVSGTVKKISVRATEIETFQRQTVILPNSILINGAVGNWTHKNKLGRIEVPIAVLYRSDAKAVYDILLDVVRKHPMILKNPEPTVVFTGFSDTGMTFEARGFLADINAGVGVRNDLRFSILDAFKAADIELAYSLRPAAEDPAKDWPLDDEKAEAEHMAKEARKNVVARPKRPERKRQT